MSEFGGGAEVARRSDEGPLLDPVEMRLKLLDGAGANAGGDKPQNVGGAKRVERIFPTGPPAAILLSPRVPLF